MNEPADKPEPTTRCCEECKDADAKVECLICFTALCHWCQCDHKLECLSFRALPRDGERT